MTMVTLVRRFGFSALAFAAAILAASAYVDRPKEETIYGAGFPSARDGAKFSQGGIAIVASSVSMKLKAPLAREARKRGTRASIYGSPALHLGDLFAEAIFARELHPRFALVEINAFGFNERIHLAKSRPHRRVTLRHSNAAKLFSEVSWSVRYELLRAGIVEALLEDKIAEIYAIYARSVPLRANAQSALTRLLKHSDTPPVSPGEALNQPGRMRELIGNNFSAKRYEEGTDTEVLADLFAWISRAHEESSKTEFVIYLPPLNNTYIEAATGGTGAWEEHRKWRGSIARTTSDLGIRLIDYTELFPDQPELFRDYGHTATPRIHNVVAARLTKELGL